MSAAVPIPVDLGDGAVVRRYTMDDLDAIWAVASGERERLGEWMPWVEGTTTRDVQRAWLEQRVAETEGFEGCGIFVGDELAGGVGLSWDPYGIAGEIGYWTRAPYEGRGLVTRSAQEFTRIAFEHVGLDWERYVEVDPDRVRPAEVDHLTADSSRARDDLGWEPTVPFEDLVRMMVDTDVRRLKGEAVTA